MPKSIRPEPRAPAGAQDRARPGGLSGRCGPGQGRGRASWGNGSQVLPVAVGVKPEVVEPDHGFNSFSSSGGGHEPFRKNAKRLRADRDPGTDFLEGFL